MGSVFSCLASAFIFLGELLENVFLALGEIGAVLVRAIFGLLVCLCDLLAAVSCCYRVPWSQRPDRLFYIYSVDTTMAVKNESALASVGGKQVLSSVFTERGREQLKEIKAARKKAAALKREERHSATICEKGRQGVGEGCRPGQAADCY